MLTILTVELVENIMTSQRNRKYKNNGLSVISTIDLSWLLPLK